MKKISTDAVFSVPIVTYEYSVPFTKEELQFIKNSKRDSVPNQGNSSSRDTYILNNPEMSDIKSELMKAVQDYKISIMGADDKVDLYITQSWLNFTNQGQQHHVHLHTNSLVSGVLYISADEENDKIFFYNDRIMNLNPVIKNYNVFNSDCWWYKVKTYKIILFPSWLMHEVRAKEGDNERISLAFNTFIKGDIGDERVLNRLIL